jgi:predicted RNA polymerase sigma factor
MELRRGNWRGAHTNFEAAIGLARNTTERRYLEKRLERCRPSRTNQ